MRDPCLSCMPECGYIRLSGLPLVHNLDEWPYMLSHVSGCQSHLLPEKRHFL